MAAGDVIGGEAAKKKRKSPTGKRLLLAFLAASVLGTSCTAAITGETTETVLPAHTGYFYVNDYSHAWSEPTEAFLYAEGVALYNATGAQIVAAAVPSTFDDSLAK